MAIVIAEEKRGLNWMFVAALILFIAIFAGAFYYLFFKAPQLIEVVAPIELKGASELSQLQFNPTALVESPEFKNLRQYISPIVVGELGRTNPFLPF
ncbi:MAG: hypothetical protein HZA37_01790 [Parcubacteria group bacterium]|nr:hypothetical protein [Parcubacteria group bacterium]